MKVLFLVPYPEGEVPGQRLKFEQQYAFLRSQGLEVDCRPFFDPGFYAILHRPGRTLTKVLKTLRALVRRWEDVWAARHYDLVYIFLYLAPVGPPLHEWFLARVLKKPFVYDLDDANFLPNASAANPIAAWVKWPRKIKGILPWAQEVIVVTPHLGDYARPMNPRITYIPPTIDTDAYVAKPVKSAGEPVVIGWSGSHSTSPYLARIEGVLRRLAERPDVRLHVVGDAHFRIPGVDLMAKAWSAATEVADIAAFDIGIYPLPHDPWVLGKGGLKALQYMGMGVPPVCTPYGAHTAFIEPGVTGFFADSETEWYDTIVRLIENPGLRAEVGARSRQMVVERFSVKALGPVYLDVLRRAGHG